MKVTNSILDGCLIIEPAVHSDHRGFFMETFHQERYKKMMGITSPFVQDNLSRSSFGVLRGLHFQKCFPQGRLVRVVEGEVFDVVVDIRKESPTYAHWDATILSDRNKKQVWVPPGFAHGFLVLSERADFEYKCTSYYVPDDEHTILWSDPDLAIEWPNDSPILSVKDANAPILADIDQ